MKNPIISKKAENLMPILWVLSCMAGFVIGKIIFTAMGMGC